MKVFDYFVVLIVFQLNIMPVDFTDSVKLKNEVSRAPSLLVQALRSLYYIVIVDIIVYGCIIPLLGTSLGGFIAHSFESPPKWELILVVFTTFALMYIVLCVSGESEYWKYLFGFNPFFSILLQMRDVVNTFIFLTLIGFHMGIVQTIINQDREIKVQHVSEGVVYFFIKKIFELLNLDPEALGYIGLEDPAPQTIWRSKNDKVEHGAVYMLLWAMMTACVSKLVYFNTLFTYLRAMEVFLAMKPYFEDDEDDSRDAKAKKKGYSNATVHGTYSFPDAFSKGPSRPISNRLEQDFATIVKTKF